MGFLTYLQAEPAVLLAVVLLLGLLIGSFLNVVITRLPVMMEREWRGECAALLAGDDPGEAAEMPERFNLVVPRSRCPSCGHQITALENVPILSYLFLRGRCSECGTRISIQYPLIEALSGALAFVVAWHYGWGWPLLGVLMFTWALIALAVIDLRTQYLPDVITLPLLWLGLLANYQGLFTSLESAVLGAVVGYLSLWTIYHVFKLLTGKEGMGQGDFKLLAALGAWTGWEQIITIVLLSSLVGALVGLFLILFRSHDQRVPIPYGPYLATAGWIALLWGDGLTRWYLDVSGVA
jgi:leader peptidase (prepilin peptidase)/N-methyltransferase